VSRRRTWSWSVAIVIAAAACAAGLSQPAGAAEVPCLILPYVEVSVVSPTEGLIETVAVERGDVVKKGQVLVMLEASREKAQQAVARAKAEQEAAIKTSRVKQAFAGRKVARATDLLKTSSIAQHELDEAETEKALAETALLEASENKRLAELDLQRANAELALRTVKSPINGVVVDRLQHPGELAKREPPILKLAQIDPLRVEIFAPLSMLNQITVGQQAEVRPSDQPGGVYAAKVTIVNRVVDSASGTFGVRLEIPNHDLKLPGGLQCTVKFNGTKK
jgi:RND family efflux transporter MFP subunit